MMKKTIELTLTNGREVSGTAVDLTWNGVYLEGFYFEMSDSGGVQLGEQDSVSLIRWENIQDMKFPRITHRILKLIS